MTKYIFGAILGFTALLAVMILPTAKNPEEFEMMLVIIAAFPFQAAAFLGLLYLLLKATATIQQRRDAEEAEKMGVQGVATRLYGKGR